MNISEILAQAVEYGVSDIIFSPFNPPSVRMGGIVRPLFQDLSELSADTTREMAETLLDEKALAQLESRGSAVFGIGIEGIGRFKVSVYRQRSMYSVVMRRVFPEVPGLQGLGLPQQVIDAICQRGGGLILIGGPGGSGLSTTFACAVVTLAGSAEGHVLTLEEPVEYLHSFGLSLVDQRDIGRDVPDLASGLEQAMALSPEVLCIDSPALAENADLVMKAIQSGIKVVATMPGRDVVEVLENFAACITPERVEGRPPFWAYARVGAELLCVTCQRLISDQEGQATAQWETIPAMEPARSLLAEGKFDLLRAAVQGKEGFMLFPTDRAGKTIRGDGSSKAQPSGSTGSQPASQGGAGGHSMAKLEKMLYDQDVARRQEAETVLKELAQGGDTDASMILEQFAQFYITNFEDRKRGLSRTK